MRLSLRLIMLVCSLFFFFFFFFFFSFLPDTRFEVAWFVSGIADGLPAPLTDSARVLPSIFNGAFERREARARKLLEEVVRAQGGVGGRKR